MPVFDQRGQSVTYQYNVAGNLNLESVKNKEELIAQLENLKEEFARATQQNAFDEEIAIRSESELKLAIVEVKKPEPNKQTLLDRIDTVKKLIETVSAVS